VSERDKAQPETTQDSRRSEQPVPEEATTSPAGGGEAPIPADKGGTPDAEGTPKAGGAPEAKAEGKTTARARAAAAARARAAAQGGAKTAKAEAAPEEPSPMQPVLDHIVHVITRELGDGVIEEAYINRLAKHVPTLVVKNERWHETARLLRDHPELAFDYLSVLVGIDHETHLEVYYHFDSYQKGHRLAVRVKADREQATVPSVTDIWPGADWPEREAYDLVGIRFAGHPNLKRILLPDDWVGHPLRKDYQPLDEGV